MARILLGVLLAVCVVLIVGAAIDGSVRWDVVIPILVAAIAGRLIAHRLARSSRA